MEIIKLHDLLKVLGPLFAFIVFILFVKYVIDVFVPRKIHDWKNRRSFRAGDKWRTDQELLQSLKSMNPTEFEEYIADMFTRLGYKAQAVGRSHDGGIDVVVEKDGVKKYIQCKKFITQQVTLSAMRDFYGALADHLANGQGYFITTNKFTIEAKQFAEDKPIELIDGYRLLDYIKLANKDEKIASEKKNERNETGYCPKCSGNLSVRSGKFGKFLGCSNYPKCDYTRTI